MATKPSGEYRLCCLAKQPESTFRNEKEEPMTLLTTPLEASRNSSIAKDVRKTMLEGRWHSACKKCFVEEKSGLNSRRIFYQQMETDKNFEETALLKTADDGSINHNDFPLETFDIRIGNLCNLKCRMCGPIYSTKWYSDYQALTGDDHFYSGGDKIHFRNEDLQKFKWHESPFFWDEVLKNGENILHIYMIGGEPLIIKNQLVFLRRLVEAGHASQIEIEYNSNLTVLTDEIIELWKRFKKVTVGISIESLFEENDYIRHPSKFNEIIENIRRLDKHVSPRLRIWLTTTFQVMNVFSIPRLVDWVEQANFEFINQFPHSPLLHIHPAHTPAYYNIQCMPTAAKVAAAEKLIAKSEDLDTKFAATGLKKYDKMSKKLQSIVKFMNMRDDPEALKEFKVITSKLDNLRGESYENTFPELSRWLPLYDTSMITAPKSPTIHPHER